MWVGARAIDPLTCPIAGLYALLEDLADYTPLRWDDLIVPLPCKIGMDLVDCVARYQISQEGPAIRTAIVTKEKREPAGREFVSVCV